MAQGRLNMISINLAFIAANGLGIWNWDLQRQENTLDDSIFASDDMRNENFSHAVITWESYLNSEDRKYSEREIQTLFRTDKQMDIDFQVYWPNGTISHRKALVTLVRDDTGEPIKIQGANIDITEFKVSDGQFKYTTSVFTHAKEGVAIADSAGNIIDVNNSFTIITGYSYQEAVGKNPRILKSGRHSPAFYTKLWKTIAEKDHWRGEIWNCRKNGEVYPEILSITLVRNNTGNITHYIAIFTDISHIKEQQRKLKEINYLDLQAHLPNRALLKENLSSAKRNCQINKDSFAVVFIDLDDFKVINDKHGQHIGDELLTALSYRMKKTLRKNDSLTQIGGDEFIVILTGFENNNNCKPALERLLLAISDDVTVEGIKLKISASMGVTLYPQDNSGSDQLRRHAALAMYEAKKAGKNGYHFFDLAQDMLVHTQREDIDRITFALKENEFILYYQPKVNISEGTIIGAEALIRWQHPEHGLIPPGKFLPSIENHPISIELGEWVIATAVSQIAEWQTLGLDIPISINISALQLQQNNFAERLKMILAGWPQVNPNSLQLEVLETSALDNISQVSKIMHDCIKLGVSFALDDFGTGYSSLTYLRHLPIEIIKIDQSFVRDMLINTDDLMIIESVVGLAKSFKRDVIAEGVETTAHSNALLDLGCELIQGYSIAKPMNARKIPQWVANWPPTIKNMDKASMI